MVPAAGFSLSTPESTSIETMPLSGRLQVLFSNLVKPTYPSNPICQWNRQANDLPKKLNHLVCFSSFLKFHQHDFLCCFLSYPCLYTARYLLPVSMCLELLHKMALYSFFSVPCRSLGAKICFCFYYCCLPPFRIRLGASPRMHCTGIPCSQKRVWECSATWSHIPHVLKTQRKVIPFCFLKSFVSLSLS